ncbi:MAG: DUF4105 domain-containing protein [Thiohalocapsa sp.]
MKGLFRRYEAYYVVADERDVIGVRTNHLGETVQRYSHVAQRTRVLQSG